MRYAELFSLINYNVFGFTIGRQAEGPGISRLPDRLENRP